MDYNFTDLNKHKQKKKTLTPPLLDLDPNRVSWCKEYLPELLWIALIFNQVPRDQAMNYFQYVGKYIKEHKISNITHSGINKYPEKEKVSLINHLCNFSDSINKAMEPILLYSNLPSLEVWKKVLKSVIDEEKSWQKIGNCIGSAYDQDSILSIDIRWVDLYCNTLADEIKFLEKTMSVKEMILNYPNSKASAEDSALIRSMGLRMLLKENSSNWVKNFWKYSMQSTSCITSNITIDDKYIKDLLEAESIRKNNCITNCKKNRSLLIDAYFEIWNEENLFRFESLFGITIHALNIYTEILVSLTDRSISARLCLRALTEMLITLKYLLKEEKTDPEIWKKFRSYGAGQSKLMYGKLKEYGSVPLSINIEKFIEVSNQDIWHEFISINLGDWDQANLRERSKEVCQKDLYDKFYDYTSSYMHSNWFAIREASLQMCQNPLHQCHSIPSDVVQELNSTTEDATYLINMILQEIQKIYPTLKFYL